MTGKIAVVDLFSGAGGLAEGFAGFRDPDGHPYFDVRLSVEMDKTAYKTTLLRNFLRKFPYGFPSEYYDFLNGMLEPEPKWRKFYPDEWEAAYEETHCLELGSRKAKFILPKQIRQIRREYGSNTILIGGPPCQSYSLVNRGRQIQDPNYDVSQDKRQKLYKEFADILAQLQPAMAVMENVPGLFTAVDEYDELIFPDVMKSLKNAGGEDQYRLYSLDADYKGQPWGTEGLLPKNFKILSEEYDIPQTRHRIFIICIRHDIVEKMPADLMPSLRKSETSVSLYDVIGLMPKLRSRLVGPIDDGYMWQETMLRCYNRICDAVPDMTPEFRNALDRIKEVIYGPPLPSGNVPGHTEFPDSCLPSLVDWLYDPNLTRLPNNVTPKYNEDNLVR